MMILSIVLFFTVVCILMQAVMRQETDKNYWRFAAIISLLAYIADQVTA